MTKKVILQIAATIVISAGAVLAALDPVTRMEKVKDLFTQHGADTFKILNGQGVGGTGVGEEGKGAQAPEHADIATVISPVDGNSFVFCVSDGKWVVYPPEPMKLGTNAMSVLDAGGKPFVPSLIQALRNSPDGKASRVPYTTRTPDGRVEKREATVWNSRTLLSRKNDTGKKFFCGTSVKAD